MDILNLKAIKNDLEAYCYKMKDICGSYGSHEKYIDPSVKDYIGFVRCMIEAMLGYVYIEIDVCSST